MNWIHRGNGALSKRTFVENNCLFWAISNHQWNILTPCASGQYIWFIVKETLIAFVWFDDRTKWWYDKLIDILQWPKMDRKLHLHSALVHFDWNINFNDLPLAAKCHVRHRRFPFCWHFAVLWSKLHHRPCRSIQVVAHTDQSNRLKCLPTANEHYRTLQSPCGRDLLTFSKSCACALRRPQHFHRKLLWTKAVNFLKFIHCSLKLTNLCYPDCHQKICNYFLSILMPNIDLSILRYQVLQYLVVWMTQNLRSKANRRKREEKVNRNSCWTISDNLSARYHNTEATQTIIYWYDDDIFT